MSALMDAVLGVEAHVMETVLDAFVLLKARIARIRLQKVKGELVDRARAVTAVFELARRGRDAWRT